MSALQALLRRHRDPAIEQPDPLDRLFLNEEKYPWPKSLHDYAEALRELATSLRGTPEDQRRWQLRFKALCEDRFGGLLLCRDPAERAARLDALNLIVCDTEAMAEALELAAARLTASRRPNMISFLRAKLIWRSNDLLEEVTRRHARWLQSAANPFDLAPVECAVTREYRRTRQRVLIRQITEAFDGVEPESTRILTGLMKGESIAEMARRTGRSRQQIYRLLERIRAWIEPLPSEKAEAGR